MQNPTVLVVDLDGTLLRSNMLHESFWSAASLNWCVPFIALWELHYGRARLKRFLAERSRIDAATLPFDNVILAYVENWRHDGGRTALVTAADHRQAEEVARQLGQFDEVYGSDPERNLKGQVKADFLSEHYGAGGFAYAGDAGSDLPVWRLSGRAITVNAPPRLRQRVEAVTTQVEHLTTASRVWRDYAAAIRPHQWLKNLLVFLPALTAHRIDAHHLFLCCLAFMAFNCVASSSYLLNDLLDLGADRAHPRKRLRPLAAGTMSIGHAGAMSVALLLMGMAIALHLPASFLAMLCAYFVLTVSYSFWLKRRPVIDICVLAGLYAIRAVAGGQASGTPVSTWLLAFSIFFFLSLAAVKRESELVRLDTPGQMALDGRGYRGEDLPVITSVAMASGYVAVLVLALYVTSPKVLTLYARPELLLGICCVLLYWETRIILRAHRGVIDDDPIVFAVMDRISQLCGVLVIGLILAATFG